MNQEEIWKPVVGFEGLYEVSNMGNVKSVEKVVRSGKLMKRYQERVLTQFPNQQGYMTVALYREGKGKRHLVHQLVLKAFVPNLQNKPQIDHIDRCKRNNRLDNLHWATAQENSDNPLTVLYRRKNTYTKDFYIRGMETKVKKNSQNAPREVHQYRLDGTYVESYPSFASAGEAIGKSGRSIGKVVDDNTLSAGGYLWRTEKTESCPAYEKRNHPLSKSVVMFDLKGNVVKEWSSIYQASKDTGITTKNIRRSIDSRFPRKYIFRFKGEPL